MKLHVVAPDIFVGDAVGNHCLSLVRILNKMDIETHAYAQRSSEGIYPIDLLFKNIKIEDTLLVSYSIHDPFLEQFLTFAGRKICYFHGVTSPELLRNLDPVTAELCLLSYEQFPKLQKFDLVATNSYLSRDSLSKYMLTDNILVIPPITSDMGIFQHNFSNFKESNFLNILVIGRVVPHKSIEDAIEILAKLRVRGINARLCVVGDVSNNQYLDFLEKRINILKINDFVSIDGKLNNNELLKRIEKADVFLSVSRHEGFCIPVLEAMYAGLPAFVRSGTAASEVGVGAVMEFDNNDSGCAAIISMYLNENIRQNMILKGRERASVVLSQASDNVIRTFIEKRIDKYSYQKSA